MCIGLFLSSGENVPLCSTSILRSPVRPRTPTTGLTRGFTPGIHQQRRAALRVGRVDIGTGVLEQMAHVDVAPGCSIMHGHLFMPVFLVALESHLSCATKPTLSTSAMTQAHPNRTAMNKMLLSPSTSSSAACGSNSGSISSCDPGPSESCPSLLTA